MKIFISIGREIGGVTSFSLCLGDGFKKLGYDVIFFKPHEFLNYYKELKKEENLKILSTTGVFLAPLFKNTICVAHGFPRIDGQGFLKWLAITISFYIASKKSKLVSVSHYVKNHIKAIYGIKSKGVVYNPLKEEFFQEEKESEREYITYVGRMHQVKNLDKFFEPLRKFKDKYKIIFVGTGNVEIPYEFNHISHMEPEVLRELLYKSKVFFSGCETEALGISYIEALACGANVVMPLSGGGLEVAPELMNRGVFTFHPSFEDIEEILEDALNYNEKYAFNKNMFKADVIAKEYLKVANG